MTPYAALGLVRTKTKVLPTSNIPCMSVYIFMGKSGTVDDFVRFVFVQLVWFRGTCIQQTVLISRPHLMGPSPPAISVLRDLTRDPDPPGQKLTCAHTRHRRRLAEALRDARKACDTAARRSHPREAQARLLLLSPPLPAFPRTTQMTLAIPRALLPHPTLPRAEPHAALAALGEVDALDSADGTAHMLCEGGRELRSSKCGINRRDALHVAAQQRSGGRLGLHGRRRGRKG